jgi:1-acyl-sn-glycerol-3-phosphate acyltransferase
MSKIPDVATLTPTPDREAIEAQVLAITRDLLRELGNSAAVESLKGSANLESDLGLGSIERLELVSRLERSFGGSLPESAVAEAKSLDDIVAAIAGPTRSGGAEAIEQARSEFLNATEWKPEVVESAAGEVRSEVAAQEGAGAATQGRPRFSWRAWELIYGIYAAGVFLVWLVFAWLVLLVTPRGRPAARMSSAALRVYFRLVGCPLRLEGREHLGSHGASIYVSNHTSYSDVLAVMALFHTNYHFVAKNEINDMPFIGTFLRKLGHFAFDRNKLRARSHQAEQMEKSLLRGESVFVFAEGTFTAQPGVRPFQLGAFRAAVKTGRPIIPVALRGTRRFLRDGTFLPKPTSISLIVCAPIFPSLAPGGREWTEVLRLRDETRRIISSHSGEPLLRAAEPHSRT